MLFDNTSETLILNHSLLFLIHHVKENAKGKNISYLIKYLKKKTIFIHFCYLYCESNNFNARKYNVLKISYVVYMYIYVYNYVQNTFFYIYLVIYYSIVTFLTVFLDFILHF